MRRTLVLIGLALAAASPALAQANRGSFGLDAMVAPTTGLGFAYYVTDGLSLRPWIGLGYSGYSGVYANVGAQLRWEIAADSRWSPYVSATALYSHNGAVSMTSMTSTSPTGGAGRPSTGAGYQPYSVQSNAGQFGLGAGLRRRVSQSLALFAEGRLMYTTYPLGTAGTGWSTSQISDNTRAEAVLGLTYLFR
jgi:hypothetical protein